MNSKNDVVGGNSKRTFTLHWIAEAGEHSYTVKLYSVSDGKKSEEDERGGKVMVASPNQQFAVSLEAFPTELEGGGTVYFTIKGWNYAHSALNVQFHVMNESGKVVYPKDGGWISKYLPEGASNYTLDGFSWDVHGVGDHTYTLIARISGEEEKDTATITVKPVNGTELKQVGFECNDPEFNWNGIEYKATLTCRAFVYNPTPNNIGINIVQVKEWYTDNSEFTKSFNRAWSVEYPDEVDASGTATIVFKNTAHTGLITLEKDLFGAYVSVSLKYTISPKSGDDVTFVGTDIINIKQDNKDVAVDVGTNFILIGGDIKVIIISAKLIKIGEAVKGLSELAPVIADFIRRAYGWR